MKEDYDFIFEWAIWGHLDSKKEYEVILLKGHIIIETILDTKLKRCAVINLNKLSFYSKIKALEKKSFSESNLQAALIDYLFELNRLRNDLAHDFHFKVKESSLLTWADTILLNLDGEKFSNFTFRTKIVHAFSYLSKNILSLE